MKTHALHARREILLRELAKLERELNALRARYGLPPI